MPRGRGRGFYRMPFGEDKKHFGGARYEKHREGRSRSRDRTRRRDKFHESSDARKSSKSSYSKSSRDKRRESSYERRKKSKKSRSHSNSVSSPSSRSSSSSSSSSNPRSYTKSPSSKLSSESSKRPIEGGPTSPVRKQVVQGPPVYSQETQIQPAGWYPPNQNFQPAAPPHPRPFSQPSMPPINYPNDFQDTFDANYSNQNFNGSYYPNYYPPPVNNAFPQQGSTSCPAPPPVHEYNIPSQGNWEGNVYPDISLPPPVIVSGNNVEISTQPANEASNNVPDHKKEAVEHEMLQQKKTLSIQREDYVRKSITLTKELSRLKEQKNELLQEKSSEDTERILKENAKLQSEIQQKLKAITNVVEMLTGIIGDNRKMSDIYKDIVIPPSPEYRKRDLRQESSDDSSSPSSPPSPEKKRSDRYHQKEMERPRSSSSSPDTVVVRPKLQESNFSSRQAKQQPTPESSKPQKPESLQSNLVHYDPEIHWCASCDVFPKTYTDYLIHLHSDQHSKGDKDSDDPFPWHETSFREQSPTFNKILPSKRVPIRGVQFVVPSSGWFCKLCKVWLGDLHCASNHLRSLNHSNKYNEYTAVNPHWEVDWMSDRTKSYERSWMRNASEAPSQQIPPPMAPIPLMNEETQDQQNSDDSSMNMRKKNPPSQRYKRQLDVSLSSITNLSDQLLAMLNANSARAPSHSSVRDSEKDQESSSSSEDSSSSDEKSKRKEKKKKKKSKKSKKRKEKDERHKKHDNNPTIDNENRSDDGEFIESEYVVQVKPQVQQEFKPDDQIINEWMLPPPGQLETDISCLKGRVRDRSESAEPSKAESIKNRGDKRYSKEKHSRSGKQGRYDHHDGRESREASGDSKDSRGGRESFRDRRDRRDSREKRGYNSSRDRKGERERDNRRRGDEKERLQEKVVVEKNVRPEKPPQGKIWAPGKGEDDDDNTETMFEKRTSESAAKKKDLKKVPFLTLPKSKLPFIGRMPILKKKPDAKSDESVASKENEKLEEKFYEWPEVPLAPEPPVISDNANPDAASSLPKSTLIISKRPRLAEPEVSRKEVMLDNMGVQDMDIADEDGPKDELPRDFKEALNILFPDPSDKDGSNKGSDEKKEEVPPTLPSTYVGMSVNYMVPDATNAGMYTAEQQNYMAQYAQYGGDPAYLQQYMAYAQQSGYMMDPNVYAQMPAPPQISVPPPSSPLEPQAPPPPMISEMGKQDDSDDSSATKKKKNPPSQRYRRHLAKKKAEEGDKSPQDGEAEDSSECVPEEAEEQGSEKHKPPFVHKADMSDLALLGIDEEDTFAQSFS